MNHINKITSNISKSIINYTNNVIREGLGKQGFKFDTDEQLVEFIKEHCKCVSILHDDGSIVRTYAVKGKPFIMHITNSKKLPDISMGGDGDVKISASIGSFNFINN